MKKKEEPDKYSAIKEHLRATKGFKTYGCINLTALCLISGVSVLKKFKVPDF